MNPATSQVASDSTPRDGDDPAVPPKVDRSRINSQAPKNVEAEIESAHAAVTTALIVNGVRSEELALAHVRPATVLYMIYWNHRLHNNSEEQSRIKKNLVEYIGTSASDPNATAAALLGDQALQRISSQYVKELLLPTETVDLVVMRPEPAIGSLRDILCVERDFYPHGYALPGGIVTESDEDNALNLPPRLAAALRVGAEKVLGIKEGARFTRRTEANGQTAIVVQGANDSPALIFTPEDGGGYQFRENIRSVLRPSDPRHLVQTTGFKCILVGEPAGNFEWKKKGTIMSPSNPAGGLAFEHHREIISHITAQTSVEKERCMKEREFVRAIIADPLASYRSLSARFALHKNSPNAPFPELFPVVDKLVTMAFSDDINEMCKQTPMLAGLRDKAIISLRQVCLKNRTFCPYLPTMRAIAEGVAFFDVVARQKKGFYDTMPKDSIVEHDPRSTPHASYHMYRYKYRLDELLGKIPHEIIIPSFESLSATDLMRVRGVPIRFVGLSKDFLYVDEFEQSPEEFFMHDANHSWRMMMEDLNAELLYGRTPEQLLEESNAFIDSYLDKIKIRATDSEEIREIKKLKKIILFEIVHEDARPFLKDVICKYIQVKEGGVVPFEVPRVDHRTGYMDVVDTLDTGISTLSYVRSKLQHGFYDNVDAQMPQIVGPKYRTSEWIARAAYEMLVELDATPEHHAHLDGTGRVSYEWLLRRTCSVGPDNIHESVTIDPALETYGDDAVCLNPKRYRADDTAVSLHE